MRASRSRRAGAESYGGGSSTGARDSPATRRGRNVDLGVIQVGDLTLDLERHMFWRGDYEIHLSPKEFDLLTLMMKNTDVLLPHVKLLRSVWALSTEVS